MGAPEVVPEGCDLAVEVGVPERVVDLERCGRVGGEQLFLLDLERCGQVGGAIGYGVGESGNTKVGAPEVI